MSKRIPIIKLINWALFNRNTVSDNNEIFVLIALITYSRGYLDVFTSNAELAALTGYSTRNIQRATSSLVKRKLLYRSYDGKVLNFKINYQQVKDNWHEDRLPKYSQKKSRPYLSDKTRWEIFARDNFTCKKCNKREFLEIDHIIPFAKGGKHTLDNFQTLCQKCNSKKRDNL
tara:strand:+ start:975 stop:1493 length:519 start_codon:yes stop_codon:yes gene_type:complete